MATVYGNLSSYVAEGYVASGYVLDGTITNTFSINVSADVTSGVTLEAELICNVTTTQTTVANNAITAELSLSALNTFACTATGLLQDDIAVDSVFAINIEPNVIRSADAEFGLLTTWSAQASPIAATTLLLSTAFSSSITAEVSNAHAINMSVAFTQSATANNLIILPGTPYDWDDQTQWDDWYYWQEVWNLPTVITVDITPTKIVSGELDITSAMSFEASIVGQRQGDIDVITSFTQTTTGENQISATVDAIDTAFTTDITAGNIKTAELALDCEFTQTTDSTIAVTPDIDTFEVNFAQTTQAVNSCSAEQTLTVEFTLTARSVLNGELNLASEFTQTVSAIKVTGATERVLTIYNQNRTLNIPEDIRSLLAA